MSLQRSNYPRHSRIFITGVKEMDEGDYQREFKKFGDLQEIFVPRGNKGLAYIQYKKSSSACLAIEEMHGRIIEKYGKKLSVRIAHDKGDIALGIGEYDDVWLKRLFVTVPSGASDNQIELHFGQYGRVTELTRTKDGRFMYVDFEKCSQAAHAVEGCDKVYHAHFGDPLHFKRQVASSKTKTSATPQSVPSRNMYEQNTIRNGPVSLMNMVTSFPGSSSGNGPSAQQLSCQPFNGPALNSQRSSQVGGMLENEVDIRNNPQSCCELYVMFPCVLSRHQVHRFCDLIPGLQSVDIKPDPPEYNRSIVFVRYSSPSSATWAWEKLQDFEYPPGQTLRIRYSIRGYPKEWDTIIPESPKFAPLTRSMMVPNEEDALPSWIGNSARTVKAEQAGGFADLEQQRRGQSTMSRELERYSSSAAMFAAEERHTMATTSHESVMPSMWSFDCRKDCSPPPRWNGPVEHSALSLRSQRPLPNTSVGLCPAQSVQSLGTSAVQRLFIILADAIPHHVLQDAFSSFGDLIEIYLVPGKTYGYAAFASEKSAENCINTLNNQLLYGVRVKVMKSDPKKDSESYGSLAAKKMKWSS